MLDPLATPEAYQAYIYALPEQYPSIQQARLIYIPGGALFGRLEGFLTFEGDVILCVQEFLNFMLGIIVRYSYEVSQPVLPVDSTNFPSIAEYCRANYHDKTKLYWYDSFPHPHIPALQATHPHHKHVPPDIKHNRILAPGLSFTRPNLPFLIEEIEQTVLKRDQ